MGTITIADLQPFVDRLLARSVLSATEQAAILALPTQRVALRARTDFVRLDEPTSHSCFVSSGLVARVGQTRSGSRQITAFHIPGDVGDLHSAIRPIGLGGMTALCETVILRIPHGTIRRLAANYSAIAEAFWRDSTLDAAILNQWVVNLGRKNARTRIAHILCEMSMRYGRGPEPLCRYNLPITQEQLADAVGLTGVHVNRSMKSLREAGLASLRSGTVTIANWSELARVGEFDPGYLIGDTGPGRQERLL